jgi:hypothetical protein
MLKKNSHSLSIGSIYGYRTFGFGVTVQYLALGEDVSELVGCLLRGEGGAEGAVHRRLHAKVQGRPGQLLVQAAQLYVIINKK